ncbi:sulfate reduction electron transfer complex DsrMKJOP subunit DsrO [Thiohalocapsa sp.]|jgi:molybdopterin-containing oxidoreductase family iron-sulfur binding subunit|uniref:sulfate reduction electron transfer complex DsrMKJOP subunit DsrO n=1 Tax=Thiohalocapsa sp. TaxID=2497641 RepID=UPI0025DFCFC0|nr:4Fe-4S dicluster domain-containing protein [Thiohalocapsa sp.]
MSREVDRELNPQRRRFLGAAAGAVAGGAGGVGAAAIGALTAASPERADAAPRTEPVSDRHRWGMFVDTAKCADGCTACVDACDQENGLNLQAKPLGDDKAKWQNQRAVWIRKVKLQDKTSGHVTNLPLMCQHCEHPPCVDVCPTGASFKRADGIVMVDRHTCIGCRYCMMACPYKARSFIHEEVDQKLTRAPRGMGCVESCNLCAHRLDNGQTSTACADACAAEGHHAIVFGDLKDPNSPVRQAMAKQPSRQIREDLELNTGVRYAGV